MSRPVGVQLQSTPRGLETGAVRASKQQERRRCPTPLSSLLWAVRRSTVLAVALVALVASILATGPAQAADLSATP